MRGRKPKPRALAGQGRTAKEAQIDALPRCPDHLSAVARKEWRRLAKPLHDMGVLSVADRAALAAYCQSWARWVEAEEQLRKTPPLLKTPSGYVQQSPWLSIANKQLEIMGRYMAELGLTPSARRRVVADEDTRAAPLILFKTIVPGSGSAEVRDIDGNCVDAPDGAMVLLPGIEKL